MPGKTETRIAKRRTSFPVAVHIFLIKGEQVLLLRRYNTGYEDGNFSVVAGHINGGETITQAAIREAKEEVGVDIQLEDIRVVGVMHRKSNDERVDFFLEAMRWDGEVRNLEPHKCDQLAWFSFESLPTNLIPYVQSGLHNYRRNVYFQEYGWEQVAN